MFTIRKTFHFSASHQLIHVAHNHPCARLHGHNYEVILELQAETLNPQGFVKDYLDLSIFKDYIDNHLDHHHLNDVLGDDNVTAEKIAYYLYHWCTQHFSGVSAVTVKETPKTYAEYRPRP